MEIQALGYLGVGTAKLDEWTSLATRGLGMETVDRGGGTRAFRMDDRKQRRVIDIALPRPRLSSHQIAPFFKVQSAGLPASAMSFLNAELSHSSSRAVR